jgi:cation transport regulator
MPYLTNYDVAPSIQQHLPEHGQNIFRQAFNHAWEQYADDPRQEEIARRVAVKRVYENKVLNGCPR